MHGKPLNGFESKWYRQPYIMVVHFNAHSWNENSTKKYSYIISFFIWLIHSGGGVKARGQQYSSDRQQ